MLIAIPIWLGLVAALVWINYRIHQGDPPCDCGCEMCADCYEAERLREIR